MPRTASTRQRPKALPLYSSIGVDPDRLARLWSLSPAEREAAARRGEFSLGELCRWARRFPAQIRVVDGDYWFLTELLADLDDD